jgi:alpha/beta superfamily hydrolase
VERVVAKLRTQKGIVIDHEVAPQANHFWVAQLDEVERRVGAYLDKRLAASAARAEAG